MNITSIASFPNFLAQEGSQLKGSQMQQAIQVAVLKQTMDQQKAAGEALVQMIQSGPRPDTGNLVDIRV